MALGPCSSAQVRRRCASPSARPSYAKGALYALLVGGFFALALFGLARLQTSSQSQWDASLFASANRDQLSAQRQLIGTVTHVIDGDTVTLALRDGRTTTIHLTGIDAPQLGAPFADQAQAQLSTLVDGRAVSVTVDHDRYGALTGTLRFPRETGPSINEQMVAAGAAWVDLQATSDPHLLLAERLALRAKRGLWALPKSQRVPPWEWRKLN